ncbi:hypothetical protein K4039_24910 [Lyngbya sp. CCAP 1446/10]|uniref:hypothetical protein n=1 Tax=Lyngbya sp. CCAP 1446/10 TaxID=439293 RepID=UPI002238580E|nr:hypothetical protein [Lyngbya sp. CCAP 1446/10]MCW6053219.1 hypothetical protein [Lyngbya sp. CCAP 1446/10]
MSKKKTKQVQYRLWTPVANAYDIYRRRLIANPEAFYEHTWRLIHIQESLIVTLGSSGASHFGKYIKLKVDR